MEFVYTLSPEYASQSYLFGYFIGIIGLWAFIACIRQGILEGFDDGVGIVSLFLGVATALALWAAWSSHDSFKEKPNVSVIGTLVDNYEASVTETRGKMSVKVDYAYVIYATPEGEQISFSRNVGQAYPKQVYLYRNPK